MAIIRNSRRKSLPLYPYIGDVAEDGHQPQLGGESLFLLQYLYVIGTEEIPTAGVDGVNLYINPKFWSELAPKERKGLLYHELMHVLLGHPLRCGHRDQEIFNVACDMCINTEAKRRGIELPPRGQYLPPELDTPILPSPEEVYEWLIDNKVDTALILESAGGQDVIPPTKQGKKKAQSNLKAAILNQRAQRGNIFSGMQKPLTGNEPGNSPEIDAVLADFGPASDVNWRAVLGKIMLSNVRTDSTWNRPATRLLSSGIYAPSNTTKGVSTLVAAVDVSSSMPGPRVGRIMTDLDKLRKSLLVEKLHIVTFNYQIVETKIVSLHEPLNFRPQIGGGTSFSGPVEYANRVQPDYLIVLTDGEAGDPTDPFPRTIWIIYDTVQTPYPGEVLHV